MFWRKLPRLFRSKERLNQGSLKRDVSSSWITIWLAATISMSLPLIGTGCGGIQAQPSNNSSTKNATVWPNPSGQAGPFFGLNTNGIGDRTVPWPGTVVPLTSWRSLAAGVLWADINTGPGQYDFSRLDRALSQAEQSANDIMFTMYATPTWASSRGIHSSSPNTSCALQQDGPGICDPPVDLNCDGTGSNQDFQDFVRALVQHVGPGKIKYWEMWNEPNISTEWNGGADCPNTPKASLLMLARMARDMKAIVSPVDPNAKFTTPSVCDTGKWIGDYLTSTDGGNSADIISFHGYVNTNGKSHCPTCSVAEMVADQVDKITASLPASQKAKPLFDTEGSWGYVRDNNNNLVSAITDPDEQVAFVARFYLLQMGKQVGKFYWYSWNYPLAPFYDANTSSLTGAGKAYLQIVAWTDGGANSVGSCSANGTVWTCPLTATNGAEAEAMWDTSQTCSAGNCTTHAASIAPQFNAYLDLAGNSTAVSGQTAQIGLKPILLITR
jgi:hypothetical protein